MLKILIYTFLLETLGRGAVMDGSNFSEVLLVRASYIGYRYGSKIIKPGEHGPFMI